MSCEDVYEPNGQNRDDNWWKRSIIYHIYLPSFMDSNGDGIGDFPGLTGILHFFPALQIRTLMISPFFASSMYDNGYDVTDYYNIDPRYGTMADFDNFMAELKLQDLNIIIDLPINHTSCEHEWFLKSARREEPYTDYYIWSPACESISDRIFPNNWISLCGGSAWEWVKERNEYYFHQFMPEQPDLNFRNSDVKQEIRNVLSFWLSKGVDGFRIGAGSFFFVNEDMPNEPTCKGAASRLDDYHSLNHIHTKGLPENRVLFQEWHDLLDEYSHKTGKYKLLIAEIRENLPCQILYYGDNGRTLVDVPLNFCFVELKSPLTPKDFQNVITNYLEALPFGRTPNWVIGSHDNSRLASRISPPDQLIHCHMVVLLLPGVLIWYYGDEIGMEDVKIDSDFQRNAFPYWYKVDSRSSYRTPMQWNGGKSAGFSMSSKPWLPIHENYKTNNIEVMIKNQFSTLEVFQKMLVLRDLQSVKEGSVEFPFIDEYVFSMLRSEDHEGVLLIINMGYIHYFADFSKTSCALPDEAHLVFSTNPFLNGITQPYYDYWAYMYHCTAVRDNETWKFQLSNIYLLPYEAMVLLYHVPRTEY